MNIGKSEGIDLSGEKRTSNSPRLKKLDRDYLTLGLFSGENQNSNLRQDRLYQLYPNRPYR